mgnify:CR=1 FL=1
MKSLKNGPYKMARYKNSFLLTIRGSPKSTPTAFLLSGVEQISVVKRKAVELFLYCQKES